MPVGNAVSFASPEFAFAHRISSIAAAQLAEQLAVLTDLAQRSSRVWQATRRVGRAVRVVEDVRRAIGPRSLLGELVLLVDRKAKDSEREGAARRLAAKHVTHRAVFHPNRWQLIRDAFDNWRGERSLADAWEDLVAAYILEAISELPRDTLLGDVWPSLRRRLRPTIERELLGRTLDTKSSMGDLSENVTPSSLDLLQEAAAVRLDFLVACRRLSPEDRALLLEYSGASPAEHVALAARLGIRPDLLRRRVANARRRLGNLLR